MKDTPNIFNGLPSIDLDDNWETTPWNKKVVYYSRPPEIPAFAYDFATNHPKAKEVWDDYSKIGGNVFNKFVSYVKYYKKNI